MRVAIRESNFGRTFDLFFITESPNQMRIIRPSGVQEDGEVLWVEEEVPEGVAVDMPSLRLSRSMLDALKESLKDSKVEADDELVRAYRKEQERVDKLIDVTIALAMPPPPTYATERNIL